MDPESVGPSGDAYDDAAARPMVGVGPRSGGSFRSDSPADGFGPARLRGFRTPDPVLETPDAVSSPPPPKVRATRAGTRWALSAVVIAAVAMAVIAVLAFKLGSTSPRSSASTATPSGTAASSAAPSTLAVSAVYKQVVPSVVLITTSKGSLGSGVIVTDSGTILTANHVISGGGTVTVLFSDGTRSAATVASSDKTTDMATLTPATLPELVVPATLGGSVAVGDDVVAIGNPLELQDSTTSGVVSGLNRSDATDAGTMSGLIQFDAAVNPGSSGGPLLDNQGSVIGIVVSIANPGKEDAFAGIGFAVPIGSALGGGGSGSGNGRGPQI